MASSELMAIIVKCSGCEKTVVAGDSTFDVERESLCAACSGDPDSYTCFCNGGQGQKSLSFCCPSCNYYGTIHIT